MDNVSGAIRAGQTGGGSGNAWRGGAGWLVLATALACSATGARGPKAVPEAHTRMALAVFEGSRTCARAGCHTGVPAEVAGSLHYQFRAIAPNVQGWETNALGVATEYSGVQATVSWINWIDLVQPANTNLPPQAAGCARCHAGSGPRPNPPGQLTQADYDSIDCLICHAPGYSRTVVRTNGQLRLAPAAGVDVQRAAAQVQRPTSEMCLRCHSPAAGGRGCELGVMGEALNDPHIAAGLDCVDCHLSSYHHVYGSGDLKAADAPGSNVDCARCHTATPHQGTNAFYNAHLDRVACQTCHVPFIARNPARPTLVERDWCQPALEPGTGLYQATDVSATNLVPIYRWWNGKVRRYPPEPIGVVGDSGAKIYPWKRLLAYVPADGTNEARRLPLQAAVYGAGGNVGQAVAAGAEQSGTPYSGSWTRVRDEMHFEVQHQIAPAAQALRCPDCHTPAGGRLDFSALGYSSNQVAFLQSTAPWQGAVHAGRFGSAYRGPGSCTQCHVGKVEEVMDSVHYTWRTPNPKVAFPGGGSHGMIDRFSGLVGATALVNYYEDLGAYAGSSGCGKCHIAKTLPLPNLFTGHYTQAQRDGLDCLICHAAEGQYDMTGDGVCDQEDADANHRTLATDPQTGRRFWFQDRSLRAAESVGARVSVAACLRCHEHGQGAPDYKRGTPYDRAHDVHALAGLLCTDCHGVAVHKVARGSRVADLHGWERQDIEVDCANCHSSRPHPEWPENSAFVPVNEHCSFIACQTCHIPHVSGIARRVWASTFGVTNGPESSLPWLNATNGLFEPFSQYTPAYATRPVYRWFNGDASMLAEPVHDAAAWDFRIATGTTPGAKIHPFRSIINGLVLDRRGFSASPAFDPRFTMAAALDALQAPLKQLGFMRPEGLTATERAVVSRFPNLLDFDKEHYFSTGDVGESVNIGLGRLAVLLAGQDPFGMAPEALSQLGSNWWSGAWLGLDLPNNPQDPTYDALADPTQATGSFISLNHAIERNQALDCRDCHRVGGVMDFRALAYSPERAEHLETLFDRFQFLSSARLPGGFVLRWSTVPGHTYRLLSATNLVAGPWTAVSPATRTVAIWMQYVVPNASLPNAGQIYFRVQDVQP